jgi:hypothetical protein
MWYVVTTAFKKKRERERERERVYKENTFAIIHGQYEAMHNKRGTWAHILATMVDKM